MTVASTVGTQQPSEHRLQAMVVDYIQAAAKTDVFAFAIPNAARRSYSVGARMKREGLMSGVADLAVMLLAAAGWAGSK